MKKQLFTILKVTPEEYETIVIDKFFTWCSLKSKNQKTLQKVLTCKPLFNWWYKQLTKLEKDFVDEAKIYSNSITQEVAIDFYHQSTIKIYQIFSKPLMRKAHEA